MTLIKREDAIEAVCRSCLRTDREVLDGCLEENCSAKAELKSIPSAEAESDDLIIKGAKGIKDGLYNIKDGKLFEYKAKGGTVRVYSIVPSAEAEPKENHTQATGAKHVIKSLGTDSISHNGIDCTEFINWLLEEVMDDEMWELNAVGNGEVICRKLKKLGLLEVQDGYYIRHIENNTKESDLVYRPSAEAEPKWDCTANFVAEQLNRLRNMTDEERWEFFIKFFSPSADAVHGWIPLNEQLPKEKQSVLVTMTDVWGSHEVDVDLWQGDKFFTHGNGNNSAYEVIAWMPLPTPYKGGDTE